MAEDMTIKGTKMRRADTAFDPIAAALQQLHQSVASEAIPDEFLRILEKIDAKIAAAKPSGTQ